MFVRFFISGAIFTTMLTRGNIVREAQLLVRDYERMVICQKALGGYPGEYCPSGGSKAENPRGLRPLRCFALELPRDNFHQDTPSPFPHNVSLHRNAHLVHRTAEGQDLCTTVNCR